MVKEVKSKKPKRSLILRVAVLAFAAYVVMSLVNQQVQIAQKSDELQELQQQLQVQQVKNDDIQHALNSDEDKSADYIERMAREEFGYVKPGERVFVSIQGD